MALSGEKKRLANKRAYARRKLRRELLDPARAIARWAASALRVPTGRLAGQPFKLESWQVDFLRGALGSAHSAALSLPRKLGKTSLIAIVLLAFLVTTGPLFRARFRGLVISRDGGLAAELKRHVGEIIAASGIEGVEIKRSPAPGRIVGPNGDVDILNADVSSGHAAGADVCVIDEAGLLEERHRPLWDAVNSARSGRDGRLIALGVRATGPMFSELLARGAAGDPNVFAVDYSAPEDCDLNNESAWRKANPGLGSIKSIAYMRERAAEALAVPAAVAGFRLLDLNQKIAPRAEMLVRLDLARAAEVQHAEDLPPRDGLAYLGFDLGGSVSLTAACCMWSSGRCELFVAMPEIPTPLDRGRADGCGDLYVRATDAGEVHLLGDQVTDVQAFARLVLNTVGDDVVIGADRYRKHELVSVLRGIGQTRADVRWRGVGAGADGAADIRSFENAIGRGELRWRTNVMMRHSLSGAVLRRDANANPALAKASNVSRIDLASAAIIAAGLRARAGTSAPRVSFVVAEPAA